MAAKRETKPETVGAYLRALDPARRRELRELRDWIRKCVPEARETLLYQMPTYELDRPVCAIAAQKHYLALYVCRTGALDAHRGEFAGLDVGKGCIRFRRLADLPRGPARKVLARACREARGAG